MFAKSQFGFTLPFSVVAEVKLTSVFISAVAKPVPPALVNCPEVVVSQKLLFITPTVSVNPTSPPTLVVPVTFPEL